jgi:murein L,D-transpeptidase YcbB/YkuD
MKRTLSLVILVMVTLSLSAQTVEIAPVAPVTRQVRSLIDAAPADVRADLRNFYGPIGYRLTWIRNSRPSAQSLAVINLFENADAKGLNPLDYEGGRWQARLQSLSTDDAFAEFEVAMSSAAMRYVSDLHFGRVDPRSMNFDFDVASKVIYRPEVVWQIANAADPVAAIAQTEPQQEDYKRLLTALATWKRIAADATIETPLPAMAKLSPNADYDALPQLAAKLRAFGDLSADAPVSGTRYEGAIVDAVKHFQKRHGLDADGIVSKKTFAQLNVPASQRVQQIELALERWRWAPAATDGPSIVVNIPEFTLRARDERGELAMRVVVGKAAGHKTPVFDGDIRHIVFRPYWSVPPAIQRNEIVPHVERDRGYLARNGYEIVDDAGVSRGTSVDADTLRRLRTLQLQVRQKPGKSNALGLVKFLFPNDNNVYLHDTPSQSTFALARRDASHGCIRLEDPAALAAWALQWSPEKVKAAMTGDHDDDYVRPPQAISVMILYATAVARENGEVDFYEDIYGHDVQLTAALDQRLTRPSQEKVLVAQAGASAHVASR